MNNKIEVYKNLDLAVLNPHSNQMKEYVKLCEASFTKWDGNKDKPEQFYLADMGLLPKTYRKCLFERGATKMAFGLNLKWYFKIEVHGYSILAYCCVYRNDPKDILFMESGGGAISQNDSKADFNFNKALQLAKKRSLVQTMKKLTGIDCTTDLEEDFIKQISENRGKLIGTQKQQKILKFFANKNIPSEYKNEVRDDILEMIAREYKNVVVEVIKPSVIANYITDAYYDKYLKVIVNATDWDLTKKYDIHL